MVDEVALKSAAERISTEPPPPSEAPDLGPTEEAAPAPEPEPQPEQPAPAPPPPKPAPPKQEAPKAKPKPPSPPKAEPKKAQPKKQEAAKAPTKQAEKSSGKAEKSRGSLLGDNFLSGLQSDKPVKSTAKAPPATSIGPAQKSALDAEIRRQLKPYWKAPTGADADLLRTIVAVDLNKDGSISGTPSIIQTTGQTASNRTQVKLHQEQAIKAIKLAAPFKLPADLYDAWKSLQLGFDKRLSQ